MDTEPARRPFRARSPFPAQRLFGAGDCVAFIDRRRHLWLSEPDHRAGMLSQRQERDLGPVRGASLGDHGCWLINRRGAVEHVQGAPTSLLHALPPNARAGGIEHPERRFFVRVCAGERHLLALDSGGQLWGWGSNASGQLGTRTPRAAGGLGPVLVMDRVVDACATPHGTLLVNAAGRLDVLGVWDEQHHAEDTSDAFAPDITQYHLCRIHHTQRTTLAQARDGTLLGVGTLRTMFCRGGKSHDYLMPAGWFEVATGVPLRAATGGRHLAFINAQGELRLRGDNRWGQLGKGHTSVSADRAPVAHDYVEVACGPRFTAALHRSGRVDLMGLQALEAPDWPDSPLLALRPVPILQRASRAG